MHQRLTAQAGRAVNVSLTLRNWLIGGYIAEFELHGADRAMYGERLLDELSSALRKVHVSSAGRRQLYGFLAFYRVYPEIVRSLPAQFRHLLPAPARTERKMRTVSAQLKIPAKDLVSRLSYSHLEQLVIIEGRYYEFTGQKARYTRKRGLDREQNLNLLQNYIDNNAEKGSKLEELREVLPALTATHVQSLLRTLKKRGKTFSAGTTRAGRWFPNPGPKQSYDVNDDVK